MSERSELAVKKAMGTPLSVERQKILEGWTKAYPYPIMGLIEAMRQVQEWERHVSPEAERRLAALFGVTVAHVHEVATFFPYFTQKPTGRKRVGLCRGLSCALAGSREMSACLEKALGVREKETTPDGEYSFEEMECLGACDQAPAMIVNEELVGAATTAKIDELRAKK